MLQSPPKYLLVENVVGFEASATAQQLRTFLAQQGYAVQEFHLSPTQLGVPYSRPRFFCLARKVP
jgi:tRNA (cytosine38-C5)-methyltransferase